MTRQSKPRVQYWCDTCRDYFYGSAALIHKGSRCYAEDTGPSDLVPTSEKS